MKPKISSLLQMITATISLFLALVMITSQAGAREVSTALVGNAAPDSPAAESLHLAPDQPYDVFLPFVYRWDNPPLVTLTSAQTGDTNGNEQSIFLPGDPVRFSVMGRNNYPINVTINLSWVRQNPCGVTVVFSDTLSIPPGDWQHNTTSTVPDCPGIYTNTAQVSNTSQTASLAQLDVVNPPSIVEISNKQGFDRCHLPSVPQMQTWWDSSPYWVFNIYLGGSMFYCDDEIPDAFWVRQVAEQGWKFILTWVGPQAPCSVFREKMSSNTSTARQQGRAEASAAAAAATNMGFLGNRVIYYDLEAYGSSASSGCRAAAQAFIRGWTERLHELGFMAGGYGSPASSYIADWATNSPAPDDVWIAHWLSPARYRADATVWSSYLSNSLWNNHQRIRQYAGGHNESWGGVTLDIDSNVLDGAITTIPLTMGTPAAEKPPASQPAAIPSIRQIQLIAPGEGWVVQGERLWLTQAEGRAWQDISPPAEDNRHILTALALDIRRGWVVKQDQAVDRLTILRTADGGASWQSTILPLSALDWDGVPVAEAYLDFIDRDTGWLAIRLQSGSSFSLGRLFATQDGGITWEERALPIAGEVHFNNDRQGRLTGGPGNDQRFRTEDGGRTWTAAEPPNPETSSLQTWFNDLPVLHTADAGGTRWIVVQDGRCSGVKAGKGATSLQCHQRSSLYQSIDNGKSWEEITPLGR